MFARTVVFTFAQIFKRYQNHFGIKFMDFGPRKALSTQTMQKCAITLNNEKRIKKKYVL